MRRAVWAAAVVALTVLVQGPAHAAPFLPASPTAAPTAPSGRATTRPAEVGRTLTLITGQRVHLVGAYGHERVVVAPKKGQPAGDSLVVRRLGTHLYVYPVGIEALLGRTVDLALFDLHGAAATKSDRTAVRVSYPGARPSVPGLHLTSAKNGVARGYVKTSSAPAFGAALRHAARAVDARTSTPLAGVGRISATGTAQPTSARHYPMKTLVIKVLGNDGKPEAAGIVSLINVDDGTRYGTDVFVTDGEARVSVPAGTYSALSDDFVEGKTEDTGTESITTVNEYVVTGAGQTLTIDHRTATVRPSADAPKPADETALFLEWDRTDAPDDYFAGFGFFAVPGLDVLVTPSAPAKVGTVSFVQSFTLEQRATTPTYAYSLASLDDHIPAQPHVFRSSDLATVESTYDGDGSGHGGGFSRAPVFEDGGGAGNLITPLALGISRTEYAGAVGGAVQWEDTMLLNYDAREDPGFFDREPRSLPAGSTRHQEWFRGPLGAGIPTQGPDGFCYGCRSGNTISVGLAPVTDSNPYHVGDLFGTGDELPVARFRLYRGTTLIDDEDDTPGTFVKVSSKKRTYRAVLDVDRRGTSPRLSTQSRTELTFSSARNKGAKLPDDWFCDGSTCRVLPLLQARAELATDHQGQLPLGRSTVTVRVAQVENAKTSAIASASLEYRPAGAEWVSVDLRRVSEGVYTGVLDDRDDPGTVADLRVGAADAAGSTYRQTVVRAFTVAAK
ncbi:MAG TPA: hypothetical protein VGC37_09365 [Friedmanniella sp.]